MIDTNLSSVFYFGKPVARHMIARGQGGAIINMASINAFVISNIFPRHNVPYCVAKAGVAQTDQGHGLGLGAVQHPRQRHRAGLHAHVMTAASRQYPEIVERIMTNTPMKRYGEEEEIKGLVVYLASRLRLL